MIRIKLSISLYIVLCLVLSLSLVSAVHAQDSEAPGPTEITIYMGEFYFRTEMGEENAPIALQAGRPYALTFVNEGSVLHEVLIGQNVMTLDDGRVDGYETNLLDGVEVAIIGEDGDSEFEIVLDGLLEFEMNPGQTLTVEFTLPESTVGTWEIGCFVPDHYEAGMHAPIIVSAGGESMEEADNSGEMTIALKEFQFTTDGGEPNAPIEFQAGVPYEVTFVNEGSVLHEVLMGSEVVIQNGIADGYEVNFFGDVDVAVVGSMGGSFFEVVGLSGLIEFELDPGQSITVEFTLPPEKVGDWEIACFVPGHYEAGMHAPVLVHEMME